MKRLTKASESMQHSLKRESYTVCLIVNSEWQTKYFRAFSVIKTNVKIQPHIIRNHKGAIVLT
jgi:hypothetical protein